MLEWAEMAGGGEEGFTPLLSAEEGRTAWESFSGSTVSQFFSWRVSSIGWKKYGNMRRDASVQSSAQSSPVLSPL